MKKRKLSDYNTQWVENFSEGLAFFFCYDEMHGYLFGFINKKIEVVIEPKYKKVKSFSNGLAPVQIEGQWGFIDKKGRLKIKAQFSDIVGIGFSAGLCAVRKKNGNKFGYIGKSGFYKILPVYQLAFPFHNGRAIVAIDNGFYIIDKHGNIKSEQLSSYRGL